MKHKKILIQSSAFIADLKRDYSLVLENIDKEKYNVYSPVIFVKDDDYLELLASVIALKDFEPAGINEKINIYVGPALLEMEFDYIISVNTQVLEAQESYMRTHVLPRLNGKYDIHSVAESDILLKTIDEAIEYLNNEANAI